MYFLPRRLAVFLVFLTPVAVSAQVETTTVDPASISLRGPGAVYSLLVDARAADGRVMDRTRDAQFRSLNPQIATVTPAGVVHAVHDGQTIIVVDIDGANHNVAVSTVDATAPRRFNFENDVEPVLSRYGCNSAGCHGKAEGQNGFKLSVFGFDPSADYASLVKEARGRRIFPAAPEASLVLRKTSGQIAHGGGVRLPPGSDDYETLRAWIAAGAPFGKPTDPKTTAVRVEPRERLLAPHGQQQLRVIAQSSDGREADVTALAKFQSNNDGLASVQQGGLVTAGDAPGEAAIMASYMNQVDLFRVVMPRVERIDPYPAVPENNFIDRLVFQKLRKLNIAPSELADDAEYLRRVYLDVIGALPTADEARRFFDDHRPNKRALLVDELLGRPEYTDYWSLQWSDLLRVDRQALGSKRAFAYYKWIRRSVASNQPFDQFARAVVTAEGPLAEDAAADFYKVVTKPGDEAGTLSQVFLGVRIACAQCHHHPFDRWSTEDYYGMSAYFSGLAVKPLGRDEAVMVEGVAEATNPRTGEEVFAHPFGNPAPTLAPQRGDRRAALADWMTGPENAYFARNLANRVWAHFLGRGLIEPVDDVRVTNPPSNSELLDALAHSVIENKYDVKELIRTITASRVYQVASKPNSTNERDQQNYSRALFKRIDAEVLLDMVCQTTGVLEHFDGMPAGTRAIQLWDSGTVHYFLKVFGRPTRVSVCECERRREPSAAQVLHLLNGPEIQAKLSHDAGYVAKLAQRESGDDSLVEDLYLTFYSRRPTKEESTTAVAYIHKEQGRRREAVEDLAWTMMNSLEFVFNH